MITQLSNGIGYEVTYFMGEPIDDANPNQMRKVITALLVQLEQKQQTIRDLEQIIEGSGNER